MYHLCFRKPDEINQTFYRDIDVKLLHISKLKFLEAFEIHTAIEKKNLYQ